MSASEVNLLMIYKNSYSVFRDELSALALKLCMTSRSLLSSCFTESYNFIAALISTLPRSGASRPNSKSTCGSVSTKYTEMCVQITNDIIFFFKITFHTTSKNVDRDV